MNVQDDNRAEALEQLQERFKTGIVHFRYAKTDGTVRDAFGTLSQDLIPVTTGETFNKVTTALGLATRSLENTATTVIDGGGIDAEGIQMVLEEIETLYSTKPVEKKAGKPMPDTSQMYYDFEAKGFRSFKKDNLVKIY